MKAVIFVAFAVFASQADGGNAVAVDHRCLIAVGGKPQHLEWRVFKEADSNWTSAYVRYKGAKTVIPLVLCSQQVSAKSADQPSDMTSIWIEIIGGQFTGEYTVVTQGTSIYSFTYKNYRNATEVAFLQDHDAYEETGCTWRAF